MYKRQDILDIALKNIGRKDISKFSKTINKIRGTWRYLTNFNTRKSSKAAVEHHYDIGSADFYKMFIDNKHFQYSCGYWPNENMTLEDSQEAMINHLIKKLDIKTEGLVIFEICLDYIKETKQKIKDSKSEYKFSDYQKSERDFAFIINKNFKSQELVNIIKSVDNLSLIHI